MTQCHSPTFVRKGKAWSDPHATPPAGKRQQTQKNNTTKTPQTREAESAKPRPITAHRSCARKVGLQEDLKNDRTGGTNVLAPPHRLPHALDWMGDGVAGVCLKCSHDDRQFSCALFVGAKSTPPSFAAQYSPSQQRRVGCEGRKRGDYTTCTALHCAALHCTLPHGEPSHKPRGRAPPLICRAAILQSASIRDARHGLRRAKTGSPSITVAHTHELPVQTHITMAR